MYACSDCSITLKPAIILVGHRIIFVRLRTYTHDKGTDKSVFKNCTLNSTIETF